MFTLTSTGVPGIGSFSSPCPSPFVSKRRSVFPTRIRVGPVLKRAKEVELPFPLSEMLAFHRTKMSSAA
jgi:hypothetical protein